MNIMGGLPRVERAARHYSEMVIRDIHDPFSLQALGWVEIFDRGK